MQLVKNETLISNIQCSLNCILKYYFGLFYKKNLIIYFKLKVKFKKNK